MALFYFENRQVFLPHPVFTQLLTIHTKMLALFT